MAGCALGVKVGALKKNPSSPQGMLVRTSTIIIIINSPVNERMGHLSNMLDEKQFDFQI